MIMKTKKTNFKKLQQACLNESILKMFDSKKSIRLKTNALDLIIKTCLN